jgi:hypothetical protein
MSIAAENLPLPRCGDKKEKLQDRCRAVVVKKEKLTRRCRAARNYKKRCRCRHGLQQNVSNFTIVTALD